MDDLKKANKQHNKVAWETGENKQHLKLIKGKHGWLTIMMGMTFASMTIMGSGMVASADTTTPAVTAPTQTTDTTSTSATGTEAKSSDAPAANPTPAAPLKNDYVNTTTSSKSDNANNAANVFKQNAQVLATTDNTSSSNATPEVQTQTLYNYTGQDASSTDHDDQVVNGIKYNTSITVNGQNSLSGVKAGVSQTEGSSIIDADKDTSGNVTAHYSFSNVSGKDTSINALIQLPKYNAAIDNGNTATTNISATNSDDIINQIKNMGFTVVPMYIHDDNKPEDLRQIHFTGTLKANQDVDVNFDLHTDKPDIYAPFVSDNIAVYVGYTAYTSSTYYRFAKIISNPFDNHSKYLATYKDGDTNQYEVAPDDVQALMPAMNSDKELRVSNFGESWDDASTNAPLFTGGSFIVKLASIKQDIANKGFSVNPDPSGKGLMDYYVYASVAPDAKGKSTLIYPSGKPYDDKDGAIYLSIRQVVKTAQNQYTLQIGQKFDNRGVEIYDHSGKVIFDGVNGLAKGVNPDDVKITTNGYNQNVGGSYTITYEYVPDSTSDYAVSRTVTIYNVQPDLTAQNATITVGDKIPTTAADYKVHATTRDGKDATVQVNVDDYYQENGIATKAGKYPVIIYSPDNNLTITVYLNVLAKDGATVAQTKQVTRTINYIDDQGKTVAPAVTQSVTFSETGSTDKDGNTTWNNNWKAVDGNADFSEVDSPKVTGMHLEDAKQATIPAETVNANTTDETVPVKYAKDTDAAISQDKTVTRTINYVDDQNKTVAPAVTQSVTYTETGYTDENTHAITWNNDWKVKAGDPNFGSVKSPAVANLHLEDTTQTTIPAETVNANTADEIVPVKYADNHSTVTDSKEVTRTITYVDTLGNSVYPETKQTITFTRTGDKDDYTNQTKWGDWVAINDDFAAVKSPEITGWHLQDSSQATITAENNVASDTQPQNVQVIYEQSEAQLATQQSVSLKTGNDWNPTDSITKLVDADGKTTDAAQAIADGTLETGLFHLRTNNFAMFSFARVNTNGSTSTVTLNDVHNVAGKYVCVYVYEGQYAETQIFVDAVNTPAIAVTVVYQDNGQQVGGTKVMTVQPGTKYNVADEVPAGYHMLHPEDAVVTFEKSDVYVVEIAKDQPVTPTNPSNNGNSDNGSNPTQPVNPSNNGNSGNNSNPTKPTNPSNNGNNGNGSTSINPAQPVNPDTGNGSDDNKPTAPTTPSNNGNGSADNNQTSTPSNNGNGSADNNKPSTPTEPSNNGNGSADNNKPSTPTTPSNNGNGSADNNKPSTPTTPSNNGNGSADNNKPSTPTTPSSNGNGSADNNQTSTPTTPSSNGNGSADNNKPSTPTAPSNNGNGSADNNKPSTPTTPSSNGNGSADNNQTSTPTTPSSNGNGSGDNNKSSASTEPSNNGNGSADNNKPSTPTTPSNNGNGSADSNKPSTPTEPSNNGSTDSNKPSASTPSNNGNGSVDNNKPSTSTQPSNNGNNSSDNNKPTVSTTPKSSNGDQDSIANNASNNAKVRKSATNAGQAGNDNITATPKLTADQAENTSKNVTKQATSGNQANALPDTGASNNNLLEVVGMSLLSAISLFGLGKLNSKRK
ncbi:mucin-binding protein [Fructilactobacillus sp. Tb1]|uniref:mucin-binding protein n=1 Tax=Fructilactobacillus sp. Tb1 TaxID=3422304 RepID=UPI003D2B13EB